MGSLKAWTPWCSIRLSGLQPILNSNWPGEVQVGVQWTFHLASPSASRVDETVSGLAGDSIMEGVRRCD